MTPAPIALFCFARPEHTRRTLQALAANDLAPCSALTAFADGPRPGQDDDTAVAATRAVVEDFRPAFGAVTLVPRPTNMGLADNIVDGVSRLMTDHGRAIVVEDDLVTSPYFLRYMNDALDLYATDERVMHVAGHMPPMDTTGLPETFFWRHSSCWGWASWARAWQHFSRDSGQILHDFRLEDIRRFDLDGAYPYWQQLLANHEGQLKTWAVFWYASVFRRQGLCLHPRQNMVANIGCDGTGTNCIVDDSPQARLASRRIAIQRQPMKEHAQAMGRLRSLLGAADCESRSPSWWRRFCNCLLPKG